MQSVCPIHDGNLNYKLSFETEKLPFDKGKKIILISILMP